MCKIIITNTLLMNPIVTKNITSNDLNKSSPFSIWTILSHHDHINQSCLWQFHGKICKYLFSEDNFLQCIGNVGRYIFTHLRFSQLPVNLSIDWLIIGNVSLLPFGVKQFISVCHLFRNWALWCLRKSTLMSSNILSLCPH